MTLNKRQAIEIAGSLGTPSKMPGRSYGIPATSCKLGAILHKKPNSTCSDCYALKNFYIMPSVKIGQARRLGSLDHPQWVEAMVTQIKGERWFRWHDSGDLQSVEHLARIVEVCKATPRTRHWLPTREIHIYRKYLDQYQVMPPNLMVRVSASMVDGPAPKNFPYTSGVTTAPLVKGDPLRCPAPLQNNKCGSCRKCWSHEVPHVIYSKH